MTLLLIRTALWSVSLTLLSLAALQDLRARIIPNRLVLLVTALGISFGALTRPYTLWISIVMAFVLLLLLGVLSHYDVLGAGDAKLMAAVTLLVPPDRVPVLLFAIALVGGLVSAIYLIMHRVLRRKRRAAATQQTSGAYQRWLRNERARILTGESVPYAVAILGGTLVEFISELHQCLSETSCSL